MDCGRFFALVVLFHHRRLLHRNAEFRSMRFCFGGTEREQDCRQDGQKAQHIPLIGKKSPIVSCRLSAPVFP